MARAKELSARDDVEFLDYLRSRLGKYGWTWLAVASPPTYRLFLLFKDGKDHAGPPDWLILSAQASLCFLLALLLPYGRFSVALHDKPVARGVDKSGGPTSPSDETIRTAMNRTVVALQCVFYSWCAYYVVNAVFAYAKVQVHVVAQLINICVNLVPAVLLFLLYLELSTVTNNARRDGDDALVANYKKARLASLVVAGILCLVVWLFYVASQLKELQEPKDLLRQVRVMATLGGLVHCVGLCMLVGRLSSPLINPGVITLILLYFYSALQPLAGSFDDPNLLMLLTTIAMPLKVLLFLVCMWSLSSGRLADFFRKVRPYLESRAPSN